MSFVAGDLFPLDRALRGIRDRFADAVIDADRTSRCASAPSCVPAGRLAEVAGAVANEWDGTLLTMFGLDERAEHGRYRLHVMFSMAPEDAILTLVAAVPELAPAYRAVTHDRPRRALVRARDGRPARRDADGAPRRRARSSAHDGWPAGMHPLRKDFTVPEGVSWPPRFSFVPVEGEGVFEIPVGPIHAGIIEPGHFRFSTSARPCSSSR